MELKCERCGSALAAGDTACAACAAASGAQPGTDTVAVPGSGVNARAPSSASGDPFERARPKSEPTAETVITEGLGNDPVVRGIPLTSGERVLGNVKIVRRLGAGGMGAVYAGQHRVLDLPVALKILTARVDGTFEERFLREAKLSARFDHPNIVRTINAGHEHGLFYIQMELVDGISAGELVRRRGRLSEAEAIGIVLDASRGLAEAHRRGVVHRDVKPDNILVLREAIGVKEPLSQGRVRAKLADLGLARTQQGQDAHGITGAGSTLGTPSYMAPEQIEDAANVGPSADVYSMGASLYELLVGQPPFRAPTIPSLFREILAMPAPDPQTLRPDLSTPLREIVLRALEKAPGNRFASADELVVALEQAQVTASRSTPLVTPPAPTDVRPLATTRPDLPKPVASASGSAPPIVPETAPAKVPPRWQRSRATFLLAGIAATLLALVLGRGLLALVGARPPLVVGLLPIERLTTERMHETEPLVAFLEKVTHRKVELAVSASYSDTVDAFTQGHIDLARLGGVTYVLVKERVPEAVPLVQRESDRMYHAVFYGNASRGVKTLADVKGKRFGFVDPLSTAGYVVPAVMLLDAGIDPEHDVIAEFTHAHDATVEALSRGQLDAGAVDEMVFDKLAYHQRVNKSRLTQLETSVPFQDDVWVAQSTLDPQTREALVKAFMSLDPSHGKDYQTLAALEAEATHYVPARDRDYDTIRAMIKRLRERKLFSE